MLRRTDDLALLSLVVEAGGLTAASKIAGITKSSLSRRLADLEESLGIRLIERTSRSFRVTDLGLQLCRHGATIRAAGEAALDLVQSTLSEPSGLLNIACPVIISEMIVGAAATKFALKYPRVQVTFDSTTGLPKDALDTYDLLFRPSPTILPDSEMIARPMLATPYELVASPAWVKSVGSITETAQLSGLDGIGWWETGPMPKWRLHHENGEQFEIPVRQRFQTNNLAVARLGALGGLGMARLPLPMCSADIANGRLMRVMASVFAETVSIYVVYPNRRSLTPAGRMFLEEVEMAFNEFQLGPLQQSVYPFQLTDRF